VRVARQIDDLTDELAGEIKLSDSCLGRMCGQMTARSPRTPDAGRICDARRGPARCTKGADLMLFAGS
jgi:hypothetical protein